MWNRRIASNMKPRMLRLLQLYRVIALIMVYIYHQSLVHEAWSRLGVCFFFVLTGFLTVYKEYDRIHAGSENDRERMESGVAGGGVRGSIGYAVRRIRRLFPLHVAMLVIACASEIYSVWGEFSSDIGLNLPMAFVKFILNLFLVSAWVPRIQLLSAINGEYNIATWFLSVCLLFYILTPLIIRIMHMVYDKCSYKTAVRKIMVVSALIYAVVIISNLVIIRTTGFEFAFWFAYESPISRVGDYLIGCQMGLLFLLADRERETSDDTGRKGMLFTVLLLCNVAVAALLYIGCRIVPADMRLVVSNGFYFTIPVTGIVISAAMADKYISSDADGNGVWRVVMWTAAISPFAYLIHVPVINVAHGIYRRIGDVNIWIWTAISVIITLVLSELYRRLIRKWVS